MSDQRRQYPFPEIEPRWQQLWAQKHAFRALNPGDPGFDAAKPKYYVLDMFPYPSGKGLHVGHAEGYTATDIIARYKRMNGFNVLHPMGWDAFGLPAEQFAIKTGVHPRATTDENCANFRQQCEALGFSYDWERLVDTTDPKYFKWTQWIFLLLYNSYVDTASGTARPIAELEAARAAEYPAETAEARREYIDGRRLAFVSYAPVNWSPDLGTVLANEEVEEWQEKGFTVERRPLRQWMLRITAYARRLIEDLDLVQWPDSIKKRQRNWIGQSEGAEVTFTVYGTETAASPTKITVFTTRPDTLFGATYMVLAPEHPLVDALTKEDYRERIETYRKAASQKSDLDRAELSKEKTGMFTGSFAINPVNEEPIPIWIADYVLMGYGTGAIMAVPAHDERDYEFAMAFGLNIKPVVRPPDDWLNSRMPTLRRGQMEEDLGSIYTGNAAAYGEAWTEPGLAFNSGILDGLETDAAKKKITAWLEERGLGRGTTNYKLRDWLFSRQRYWGEPFPIIWEDGQHRALPETELPLELPEMADFKPTGTTEPPLSKAKEWVKYSEVATREANTMPQWAGSSWYYLRYCDPTNDSAPISPEIEHYWMKGGVDLYVGGVEHAVLHLLYARFWHKVLFDYGIVTEPEPFQKLVNPGIILGADSQKMSKSTGNIVTPESVIAEYGADSLRLFEMFMGPLEQSAPWSTSGVEGVHRFLARVWRLFMEENQEGQWQPHSALSEDAPGPEALKALHQTIKRVTQDLEAMSFNTAISHMMVFTNAMTSEKSRSKAVLEPFLRLLSPFAPHVAEELWSKFYAQEGELVMQQPWPTWDETLLVETDITVVLQVNGKVREKLVVPIATSKEDLEKLALANETIAKFTQGLTVRKVIVVPGKLVNVVAN
jgi:leucyl-tRNA synthetase